MKINSSAQIVSIGSIFTALAVLFHSSPVFLPGIGLVLSPFATLPIALAAVASTYLGITALFSSAFILLFISPEEAVIFLLATGPLGLALGASYNKAFVQSIAITAGTLFIGINILTYVAGIAAFGGLTPSSSLIITAFIFLLFALFYSAIWVFILRFFVDILKRTRQFRYLNFNKKK